MTTLRRGLGGEEIGGRDLQSQCASHVVLGKVGRNPGCDVLGRVVGVLRSKYPVQGVWVTNRRFASKPGGEMDWTQKTLLDP